MKGHILFALLFAALMALGISSLNDLQAQKAALPPSERAAVYVAVLPPDTEGDTLTICADKVLPAPQVSSVLPPEVRACTQSVPPLLQSYYLAWYQAFHYSDRAG